MKILKGHGVINSEMANITQQLIEKSSYGVYGNGLVTSAQTVADMTVKVSAGIVYMPTTNTRYSLSATASLAVTAADATNPRYDIIYVSSAGVVSYLAGTAAATPTIPALPVGGVKLAEIYVTANKTSIVAGDITLRRTFLDTEAWQTWTPVITWPGNVPTGMTVVAKFKKTGKTVFWSIAINATSGNDAAASSTYITLPIAPKANNVSPAISTFQGVGTASSARYGYVRDNGTNNDVRVLPTLGTAGQTYALYLSGFYEID